MSFISDFIEGISNNLESTKITDMEGTGFISNEGLSEYLTDVIPPDHMNECPLIDFEPTHSEFQERPNTLAFYIEGSNEIRLSDHFENPEEFLDTVVHEIGHNEYFNDFSENPENLAKWEGLHLASKEQYERFGIGCVSDYAATCMEEDWAESYSAYIRDPDLLKWHSMEKYEFIKEHFKGREYLPQEYIGNDIFVAKQTNLQDAFAQVKKFGMDNFLNIVKGGDIQDTGNTIHCFDKLASS